MKNVKIAFLLTIYGNPKQANMFIKQLIEHKDSYIFIHIDKKSLGIKDEIIKHPRVIIIPTSYRVEWGDYSQIQSINSLMEFARNYDVFDYFSLHSGSDLAVKPIQEFVEFLIKDGKYAYLECYKLPYKKWQYGGGLGRLALYWPKCFRRKYSQHSPMRYLRSLYGKAYGAHLIKGHRLPDNIDFYGRSDWFTLRRDCVEFILNYVDQHPEYNKLFENSLIGSEIYFTTLANMFNDKAQICNDNNLRYIDFVHVDKKTPGSPKVLTMEDYQEIKNSSKFFARKFDMNKDFTVVKKFLEESGVDYE